MIDAIVSIPDYHRLPDKWQDEVKHTSFIYETS